MRRIAIRCSWFVCGASLITGCTHFIENRAIDQFSQALQQGDLEAMKMEVSDEFRQKALRLEESMDDIKILPLPKGEKTIVAVDEVSKERKNVEVEIEGTKHTVKYQLKREDKQGWVVDDIVLKQKKDNVEAERSVTEQMDLLSTVREFMQGWNDANREAVVAQTIPEFAELLNRLSPGAFKALAARVAEEKGKSSNSRPVAQMDEEFAIVKLRRPAGQVLVSCKLIDGRWRVSDAAVELEKQKEHIPSIRKQALVLDYSLKFLEGYAARDQELLAKVCTPTLYEHNLQYADFSLMPLPSVSGDSGDYKASIHRDRAFFELPGPNEIVRISLVRDSKEQSETDASTPFRVEEVTLYEVSGDQQEKRMSAVFTARATMNVFHESLGGRNLATLRRLSTVDFNTRVWNKVTPEVIGALPLNAAIAPPEVTSTQYRGPLTQMNVKVGGETWTYVLRDQNGKVRVDDVMMPPGRLTESLKKTLETSMPAYDFAAGLRLAHLGMVQRRSSDDFNRLIWKQITTVPEMARATARHLQAPLSAIEFSEKETRVVFGDEQFGAVVKIVREYEQGAIDEVELIAGSQPGQRAKLKDSLRTELAAGRLNTPKPKAEANSWPALPVTTEKVAEAPAQIELPSAPDALK